jgi:membrane associated rhomboid family serine protease
VAIARKSQRPQRTSVGAVLRDSRPFATSALIAANVTIYVITGKESPAGFSHPEVSKLFLNWQLQPFAVHQNDSYYRLITSAFLHLSLLHIASNMIALAVIGPPLERLLGPVRFTALYFLAALGGSTAVFVLGSVGVPVAGASGAIFGLFAASLIMVRRLGLDLQWLIGIIVLNFVFTYSVPNISALGHVGGFITGGVAAAAISGIPRSGHTARRPTAQQQSVGLGALAVVLAVVVGIRSATGF